MSDERPDCCTDEHLEFLDELRASGTCNMFGAGRELDDEFPELRDGRKGFHSSKKARAILAYWMGTNRASS